MYRSHRLQELLNYFDAKDTRVREMPYTLDAQLLNAAAMQLDDASLRLSREMSARTLMTTPVHLDHWGVYSAVRLPAELSLASGQQTLTSVEGLREGTWVPVAPFDDRLPVPTSYGLDPARSIVPLANPLLCDLTGSGDAQMRVWDVHQVGPLTLPIPNRLTFYVEGASSTPLYLSVLIEGEAYPVPVWARDRRSMYESLVQTTDGCFQTTTTWATVRRVVVRGLPSGARLRGWVLPVSLPAVPDPTRPFSHPYYRDQLFPRYWTMSAQEHLLKELFLLDNLSGLEVVQTYAPPASLTALAIEPHTWGLLAGAGTTLYYADRREPMPTRLDITALSSEPLYGVDCQYNFTRPGAARYLYIRPVPYGRASQMRLWRYLVESPDGTLRVLLPDGSVAQYAGGAGWQRDVPSAVNLPLVATGTYVITMECLDVDNQLSFDSVPYVNLALAATAFDLSHLVPDIQGLAFDSRENLWVWTGDSAVPLRPQYDAYVLDPVTRTLYVTGSFEQLRYE